MTRADILECNCSISVQNLFRSAAESEVRDQLRERERVSFQNLVWERKRVRVDFRNGVRERKRERVNFQKQVRERIFRRKWYVMDKFPY